MSSNRLFRSERHRNLALVSPPDTIPAYRISHEPERFCCDGKCSRALGQVESNCPRWPTGPKPSRRWALALGVFVVMLLAALVFGRPHG